MLKPELRSRAAYRVILVAVLVVALVSGGTLGFHLIERWGWFKAFYGTLMTISTIGGEPENQLSQSGRVFNVFLMLAGLSVVGFGIGSFTHAVIESEFGLLFGRRKMKDKIAKLKDHFIICGVGRVGRRIALELAVQKLPFVVVEKDPVKAAWALERGFTTLVGDATSEAVLSEVHIESARGLASVVTSDPQNVYIILTARGIAPDVPIVTRASEETAESKLVRAGATSVISPYTHTGERLSRLLTRPKVQRFIDQTFAALTDENLDFGISEVAITSSSPLAGASLAVGRSRFSFDAVVLAVRRDGELKFHPKSTETLSPGDALVALGTSADLVELEKLAAGPARDQLRV